MPYLGAFGLEFFKKTMVIFKITTLEFVQLQNCEIRKMAKFGTKKTPYFGIL